MRFIGCSSGRSSGISYIPKELISWFHIPGRPIELDLVTSSSYAPFAMSGRFSFAAEWVSDCSGKFKKYARSWAKLTSPSRKRANNVFSKSSKDALRFSCTKVNWKKLSFGKRTLVNAEESHLFTRSLWNDEICRKLKTWSNTQIWRIWTKVKPHCNDGRYI